MKHSFLALMLVFIISCGGGEGERQEEVFDSPTNGDTDTDNDGVSDSNDAFPFDSSETVDADGDGIGNNADTDDDNDGIDDSQDAFPLDASESLDTDTDSIGNNADMDDDNDGVDDFQDAFPLDATESLDTDNDGIGNNADNDDDNDGVEDSQDALPLDESETLDTDRDGIGNNADEDDDNDGALDAVDAFPLDRSEFIDTDSDGIGNFSDEDDDNDGVLDLVDSFPLDGTEYLDTDADGTGNNADIDDDNDNIPDIADAFPLDSTEHLDTDIDGVGNNADSDDDGDGVPDIIDAFPLDIGEWLDSDGDGLGNNFDNDDDSDGVDDSQDAFPLDASESVDTDTDGIGNNADTDDDNDGVEDTQDAFPLDASESVDTDTDGIGNNTDTDDDNDGVEDSLDAFPLDASESVDTDTDGIGNNADSDDDNDGVEDTLDAFPLDASESVDTDTDGIGNNADSDDDNDGVEDTFDAFPLDASESVDTDTDGIGNNADSDDDNDGVEDTLDAFPLDASESVDTDTDDIGNNADTDDDNDGVPDTRDTFPLDADEWVTRTEVIRFLVQASYGPLEADIQQVESLKYEGWLEEQMAMEPVLWVDRIATIDSIETAYRWYLSGLFWEGAIEGEDQLRQRVAFTLAQIIPNNTVSDLNHARPEIFGHYWDIFQRHAFGNYEDLLYDISVSPSMGMFLTHLNNEKEDADRGTAPDENYAREIMQLFTIGLVDLDMAGNTTGNESYTAEDVEQLARVFTGFSWDHGVFGRGGAIGDQSANTRDMLGYEDYHEFGDKTFLGSTISNVSSPEDSVSQAIKILIDHPNTPPFIAKQFIQKLVTANPLPDYVERVSTAFATGTYTMPNGNMIGEGRRGDMAAMIAAVLLDEEARFLSSAEDENFGKVRGPVLRQAQWARTFRDDEGRDLNGVPPAFRSDWEDTGMGQTPTRPTSVFSFYRPGFVLPSSETAEAGLVNPEMQIVTSSTTYGYLQYMSELITGPYDSWHDFFIPDYSTPMAMADDAESLTDYLNEIMVYGSLTDEVYERVIAGVEATSVAGLSGDNLQDALRERVEIAMMIIIASPEYITQR